MGALAAGIGAAGSIIGGITGGKGAAKAAKAQAKAYKQGLAQQQAQFDVTQKNVSPWIQGGDSALQAELALLGLGGTAGTTTAASGADPAALVQYFSSIGDGSTGRAMRAYLQANPNASPEDQLTALKSLADPEELAKFNAYAAANPYVAGSTTPGISANDAQAAAIANLKGSPLYTSQYDTGVDTVLQNASATGGLRGGNTQNSLAQFGSTLLAQVIQQQLSNLSGVSGLGVNAATGLGQISQQNSNAQSTLYGNIGQANGLAAAAPYAALQSIIKGVAGTAGNFFGGASGGGSNAYGISGAGNIY